MHSLSDTLGLVAATKPAPCGTRAAEIRCVTVRDTDGFRLVRLDVTWTGRSGNRHVDRTEW